MTDEYYASLFIRIGASVIMKQQLSGSLYFSFFFPVILMQTFRIVQFVEMCKYICLHSMINFLFNLA